MKRLLRRRSLWLAIATLPIVAAFTFSCFRGVLIMRTASGYTRGVGLARGAIYLLGADEARPWYLTPPPGSLARDPEWYVSSDFRLGLSRVAFMPEWRSSGSPAAGPKTWSLTLPLWPAVIGMPAWTVLAWRKDRRRSNDSRPRCACGYDLSLVTSPVCPECGRPIIAPPATANT